VSLEEAQDYAVNNFIAQFGELPERRVENNTLINIIRTCVKCGYVLAMADQTIEDATTGLSTDNIDRSLRAA
jgi:hypothetical protein